MIRFKEIIGAAIGEASMCWSETPKGIFDSTRASSITDRVFNAHMEVMQEAIEAMKKDASGAGPVTGPIYHKNIREFLAKYTNNDSDTV